MFFDLRDYILSLLIAVPFCVSAQDADVPMSYEESLNILIENNREIKIARKNYEIAREEKGIANSFWYPNISASGSYAHLSNKVEVRQSLSSFTDPLKDMAQEYLPDLPVVGDVLNQIGGQVLAVPLFPKNLTTVDANLIWPIFTGGKRLFATEIGRRLVSASLAQEKQIGSLNRMKLVEAYFAIRLGADAVKVRKENYDAFQRQYADALKMEEVGLINKADRLLVQVFMEESKREYEASVKDYGVLQAAFRSLLNMNDTVSIVATTPLFINDSFQNKNFFISVMKENSNLIELLELQQEIAEIENKMAKSEYSPTIAFWGRQNLASHGISKYLLPRNMIGVGFTWNIFDGLSREKKIRQSKFAHQAIELEKEKVTSELEVGIDKAYTTMQIALDNVNALNSTIALSRELLRMREKEFREGMATTTQLVDARTVLNDVRLGYLMAYYEYDVALITLLSLSGIPEEFEIYKAKGKTENFVFD